MIARSTAGSRIRLQLRLRRALALSALAVLVSSCALGERGGRPATTGDAGAAFRDGRYSATGWYGSLPSSITVDLELDDQTITAVEVTTHATDPTSLDYQRRFAEAVPDLVIGRPIADLELDRTAGSSGTPRGLNDALEQIRRAATAE